MKHRVWRLRLQRGFIELSLLAIGAIIISALGITLLPKVVGTRKITQQRAAGCNDPNAPANVTVAKVGNSKFKVSWTGVNQTYSVEMFDFTTNGFKTVQSCDLKTALSCEIDNVDTQFNREFRVQATDGAGSCSKWAYGSYSGGVAIPASCGNGVLDQGEICDRNKKPGITGKEGEGYSAACVGGADGYHGYPNNGLSMKCKLDCSGYSNWNCWSECTSNPSATRGLWGEDPNAQESSKKIGSKCADGIKVLNSNCECVSPTTTVCPKPQVPTNASSSTSVKVGETVTLKVNPVSPCGANKVEYQFRHQMLDGTSIGIICDWKESVSCQFSYNQAGPRQWQARARIGEMVSDWSILQTIDVSPKLTCTSDADCNNFGCLAARCNTSMGACEAIANAPSTENKSCETIDSQGVHHPGACKGGFCLPGLTPAATPTTCPNPPVPSNPNPSSGSSVRISEGITLKVNRVSVTCGTNKVEYRFRHQLPAEAGAGSAGNLGGVGGCDYRSEPVSCEFAYNQVGLRQWQVQTRLWDAYYNTYRTSVSPLWNLSVGDVEVCGPNFSCNDNFGCWPSTCVNNVCVPNANPSATNGNDCISIGLDNTRKSGKCQGGFCLVTPPTSIPVPTNTVAPGVPTATPTLVPCNSLNGVCVDGCIATSRLAGNCEDNLACCRPEPTLPPATEPCPAGSCVLLSSSCNAGTVNKTCEPLILGIPRVCCAPTPTPGGPTCSAAGGVCVDSCSGANTPIVGNFGDCTSSAGRICCKFGPTPTPPTTPCPGNCVNPLFGCLGNTQEGEGICGKILFDTVTLTCCVPKPTTSPPLPQTCAELGGNCVDGCPAEERLSGDCTGSAGQVCCRLPGAANTPIPIPTNTVAPTATPTPRSCTTYSNCPPLVCRYLRGCNCSGGRSTCPLTEKVCDYINLTDGTVCTDGKCQNGNCVSAAATQTPIPTVSTTPGQCARWTECSAGPSRYSGNANCNGKVDREDLGLWIAQFAGGQIPEGGSADFNCDGVVDRADLAVWISGFINPGVPH